MPSPINSASSEKSAANMAQMGFQQRQGHQLDVQTARSKQAKSILLRIWTYLRRQRLSLSVVFVSTVLTSCFLLLGPYLIGRMIDDYIVPHKLEGFIGMGLMLLGVYALGAAFTWIQQFMASSLSQHTVREMRQDLFERYQSLPIPFFDQKTHGELMSRATNDITNVSNTLNQTVVQLISSVLMLVGSVVMMLSLSVWMTLVTVLTIPFIALLTKKISKYTRQFFSEQQKTLGEVNGYVQENISGLKVVKVFGRETRSIEQFREINERLRSVSIKAQSLSGSLGPMMNTMRNISFVIIAVFGGIFAYHEVITIGVIISFLTYSTQFSQPINQLANQYNLFQSAIAGAERVFEVMDQEPEEAESIGAEIADKTGNARSSGNSESTEGSVGSERLGAVVSSLDLGADSDRLALRGDVVFENVNFGYKPDVPVLKNLSLHASQGEMIALVGPTGAGKTTIINLLTRFYDIQAGAIRIDGKDIKEIPLHVLRRRIGLVLQDAYVFSGTIRDNIRYGRLEATDQEVENAARLANADGFIRKLPNGYETELSAEGGNLSQGQRQLLTIARAVLANPSILILDEATSSVDTRTELHIQEAMKTLMKGRTSFVIAHRLSTIREADKILVINGGEVIEQGTHKELLKQEGFYANLCRYQYAGAG
ncbi:ABC transporter ATP-binding protein [Paenibacillus sp. HB172176]|uniref:ABC transporter ATP-binding protein n=1 Tax=Paenibacillus sp. HB172176 TaxID=2493690 RepID=UPI001F105A6E|nr:ABC transporter ATP-binding protein [Paenibacillus sp. HB172176]